jgi:sugar/nucleoside kinase (ribokinase family)
VGVVGEDFPDEHVATLKSRKIDTSGLVVVRGGKTFFWKGKYQPNMNDRETLEVQLNVLGTFQPSLSDAFRRTDFLFLGNDSPRTQLRVVEQMIGPRLIVADTMDLWIREQHSALMELLQRVDGLVMNDSEAKLLTGDENLVAAGRKILKLGPRFVVIKKGEHGAMFFSTHETYVLPAYPTERVIDPTGAGDSFAGGMMGYLASQGNFEPQTLKEAMAYGILVASFAVEDFSLDRLQGITRADLDSRMQQYRKMLSFS